MSRRRGIPGWWLAVVALGLALPGCDYFRPSVSPQPSQGQILADYSTVDATLETIKSAVEAKGANGAATAYLGAFADSVSFPDLSGYHQDFWPEDAVKWTAGGGTVPPDWNLKLESRFYNNVGDKSLVRLRPEDYVMFWAQDPDHPDRVDVSPSLLHRIYTILAVGAGGETADIIARGYADLTLEQATDGNWYITRWEDRSDPVRFDPPDIPQVTWGQRRLESQ